MLGLATGQRASSPFPMPRMAAMPSTTRIPGHHQEVAARTARHTNPSQVHPLSWMTTQHVHHNAPYHQHARSLRWHSLDERACRLMNTYRQGLKTSIVTVL